MLYFALLLCTPKFSLICLFFRDEGSRDCQYCRKEGKVQKCFTSTYPCYQIHVKFEADERKYERQYGLVYRSAVEMAGHPEVGYT